MKAKKNKRIPKRALDRYAELLLRHLYQHGGRERYVPVTELEDALGIEPWRILALCRNRLLGEVHVSWRLPEEVERSTDCWSPAEKLVMRSWFPQPHIRIRPDAVRLTEDELVRARPKKKK